MINFRNLSCVINALVYQQGEKHHLPDLRQLFPRPELECGGGGGDER